MAILMGGVLLRVAYISADEKAVNAAALQSKKVITLTENRAGIFDRNLKSLVNEGVERRSLIFPDILEIEKILEFANREEISAAFQKFGPTVVDTGGKIIEGQGIYNFSYPIRYGKNQIAPHIIGYMNGGRGVFGIEKSYDEFLRQNAGNASASYYTDGMGRLLLGEEISLEQEEVFEHSGVVLTLDEEIQAVAEKALLSTEKGAAVVMDIETGEILAAASVPTFDPNSIEDYLTAKNAPFVNRAFSSYTVGSTWKLVVAAAALEKGISPQKTFECKGYTEVEGRIYKCHWEPGHGEIDMERALEISCNPYFINLALEVGGEKILETAKNLGFGSSCFFAEDFYSASGKLPESESLASKTVLASFAFGQGKLMATPVQLAALGAAIANGGKAVTPKLVLGTYDSEGKYEATPQYAANRVMSTKTAALIKDMMISVVENGSGANAKPKEGGAGGKTASAQTGQYDGEGNEIIHAWFLGFYPAENPKYSVAVLAEGMNSGSDFAAPIFKEICDGLESSEQW